LRYRRPLCCLIERYDELVEIESVTRKSIETLLQAIESRDLRAVRRALHPNACWQNVPHPAAEGREAVISLLGGILCWSQRVQWDVLHIAIDGMSGSLERVDRFWLEGNEYAVACHGVFAVDAETGTVISVRDYVDLGEWRQRVNPVLEAMASRSSTEVVRGHLAALKRGAPLEVAGYFALDATLECPEGKVIGWDALADYYTALCTQPELSALAWEIIEPADAGEVAVDWRFPSSGEPWATGRDDYEVCAGRITCLRTTLPLAGS